jgi:hypothetical protein
VCDRFDRQMVDDLQAIDRFNDPATGDLLVVLLETLDAFYAGSPSRVPELVDLLSTVHAFDATWPLEEVLRDVGTGALVYDVLELAPVMLEPSVYLDLPDGVAPMDFERGWEVAEAVFAPGADGRTAIEALSPITQAMLVDDGTWASLHNLGTLLQRGDARVPRALTALPETLARDPELARVREVLPPLLHPAIVGPTLRVAENEAVIAALARAEALDEGVLPFYARMVVGGTMGAALDLVRWTLELMDEA